MTEDERHACYKDAQERTWNAAQEFENAATSNARQMWRERVEVWASVVRALRKDRP